MKEDVRQIINDKNISNLNSTDDRSFEELNNQNVDLQNQSNTKVINELINDPPQGEGFEEMIMKK